VVTVALLTKINFIRFKIFQKNKHFIYIKTHHICSTKISKYTFKVGKLLCEACNYLTLKCDLYLMIGNYIKPSPMIWFFLIPHNSLNNMRKIV